METMMKNTVSVGSFIISLALFALTIGAVIWARAEKVNAEISRNEKRISLIEAARETEVKAADEWRKGITNFLKEISADQTKILIKLGIEKTIIKD